MEKNQGNTVAVIMAGGAGTRFWPLSTNERPKQFLNLFGERSLLQQSYDRLASLVPAERILVLTNAAFVPLVRGQLPEIPGENVIGEPVRRDTAAAVCLGAVLCRKRFGNPVILTVTADHVIHPVDLFRKTVRSAVRQARASGALYTFGIRPTYPATAYGYLEIGERVLDDEGIHHHRLIRFKEKPDAETAGQYVRSGKFLWNSGMFVWTADSILAELERHLPEHLSALSAAVKHHGTPRWEEALFEAFHPLRTISIDYAVMEKAGEVRCVAATFHWSDVGGWLALVDFLERDAAKNAHRGRLCTLDAADNLVFCEDDRETVMLVGVRDLVVVRAGDKTLVVPKDRTEEIKKLVQSLEESR